jgi:hypothetical protein
MTREEFEKGRVRLLFAGVCPACGSPIDFASIRRLSLACTHPNCGFSYIPSLNERFEVANPDQERPSPARLPSREA